MKQPKNTQFDKDILLDDTESDVFAEMADILIKGMKNHEAGNLVMDTTGADYFFVTYFVNEEMSWDLDRIEEDFFSHCYNKLREFADVKYYDYNEVRYSSPKESHRSMLIGLILNGAKAGDEYCIALIMYLFKIYHKSVYKQLKRFSKISASEVTSLCEVYQNVDLGYMGIILTMCQISGITLCDNCGVLFEHLNRRKDEINSENDKLSEMGVFSHEDFDEASQIVDRWVQEDEKENSRYEKQNKIYWKEYRFVEKCLRHLGYPEDFVYECLENDMGLSIQYTRTLSVLRKAYPKREFTFEEIQRYTVLYDTISALVDVSEELDNVNHSLLGLSDEYSVWDEETLFHPENIVVKKKDVTEKQEKKVLTNIVVSESDEGTKEDYLAEINELRRKINQKENECKHLRTQYASMNAARKEMESVLSKYQNDREELIALREFVYKQEQKETEFETKSIEEMKLAIEEKNYVIIGGHINWINKLKSEFPNWTYISVDNFKNFDGTVLDNKEKLFFFTDYISHTAYGKFIKIARERKIPFSYLHGVNMEQIIRQIYESGEK